MLIYWKSKEVFLKSSLSVSRVCCFVVSLKTAEIGIRLYLLEPVLLPIGDTEAFNVPLSVTLVVFPWLIVDRGFYMSDISHNNFLPMQMFFTWELSEKPQAMQAPTNSEVYWHAVNVTISCLKRFKAKESIIAGKITSIFWAKLRNGHQSLPRHHMEGLK